MYPHTYINWIIIFIQKAEMLTKYSKINNKGHNIYIIAIYHEQSK